jgi:hypothetical protein
MASGRFILLVLKCLALVTSRGQVKLIILSLVLKKEFEIWVQVANFQICLVDDRFLTDI